MPRKVQTKPKTISLLANGSSRLWEVSIEEEPAKKNGMVIEGPAVYVAFQLITLDAVSQMLNFLREHLPSERDDDEWVESRDSLKIGRLGRSSVLLVWDYEGDRCYLKVLDRGKEGSSIHVTLHKDDIEMIIEATSQAVEDLTE